MASKSKTKSAHLPSNPKNSTPRSSPMQASKSRLTSTPRSKTNTLPEEHAIFQALNGSKARRPEHLSELAMPSPVSTPGAEHLSDVSSCCSVDDTDSNRSSPPGSPAANSFSTPANDMKSKYKLWSAIRSDYRFLMDEGIIDTCKSTESDLSLESDDQTTCSAVLSFKGFLLQFNELNNWLGSVHQRALQQCHCLSEKYVNQSYHKDMLDHLTGLKHFKEYARQLIHSCPHLKEDISQYLKQVHAKWDALERLLLPNASCSDEMTVMLDDMEKDFDGLRQWVDDMEIRCRGWKLHAHWKNEDIDRQLDSQRILQAQVELHSGVMRALLSLCDRLTKSGSTCDADEQQRAAMLQDHVKAIEKEYHTIWLRSLEWQLTLEDAKANGIHLRCDREDDQWDRMRSTFQRRQKNDLQMSYEHSSDLIDDDESFYPNRSSQLKKTESENEQNSEDDICQEQADEFLSDGDVSDAPLSLNCVQQVPVSSNRRSFSDPALNGDACDGMLACQDKYVGRSPAGSRSGAGATPLEAKGTRGGKPESVFEREWSPGTLKRYGGAVNLVAAFGEEYLELPVDVGYSSGSHSNEETDSSARQDVFVWPHSKKEVLAHPNADVFCSQPQAALNTVLDNEKDRGNVKPGIEDTQRDLWNLDKHQAGCAYRGPDPPMMSSNTVAKLASIGEQNEDDCYSIPETEDEMSLELPLDDIPVVRSSDVRAEDNSGPLLNRPLGKMAFRRSLCFIEETSASDSGSVSKVTLHHKTSPKKKSGPSRLAVNQTAATAKSTSAETTFDGAKRKKTNKLSCNSVSGSCYASSEGTESESDLANLEEQPENQDVRSGRRCDPNLGGSSSLRSSPIKDFVEIGRSPLKRRLSENLEDIFDDLKEIEKNQKWLSDSALYELRKENFISPKVPKMSPDVRKSLSMKEFSRNSNRSDESRAHSLKKKSVLQGYGKIRKTSSLIGILARQHEQVVPCDPDEVHMSDGCEFDAVVPGFDSLRSSLTELTADDSLIYSDSEKVAEEEMQWQEDNYYDGDFEKGSRADVRTKDKIHYPRGQPRDLLASLRHKGMDSDSDMEDFHHVLQESRKGLKFIESTILQEYSFSENETSSQDPAIFKAPLATCDTNIVCLQEIIDALKSKNKMDNEILQVTDIVSEWQHLQCTLLVLQKEAQRVFELQSEVAQIQSDLQNWTVEIDLEKFDSIHQLEEALKAVKAVRFRVSQQTIVQLDAFEKSVQKYQCDHDEMDLQSVAFFEQSKQLKMSCNSLLKRCEADESRLQTAVLAWHKFNKLEKEFNALLPMVSDSQIKANASNTEDHFENMQRSWSLLDEKLKQLSSAYVDFAHLCSDSSKLALKEAVMVSTNQLQTIRKKNDEQLLRLVKAVTQPPPSEALSRKVADRAIDAAPANANGFAKYVLPVALAFVLVGCLYGMFGDSWYEILGSLGMIVDPNLQHIRGPPPS